MIIVGIRPASETRQWGSCPAGPPNHKLQTELLLILGPRASVHMYINVVIKLTEDWKLCRGNVIKFVASKIIFLDSFDGAEVLSGLIELAYCILE